MHLALHPASAVLTHVFFALQQQHVNRRHRHQESQRVVEPDMGAYKQPFLKTESFDRSSEDVNTSKAPPAGGSPTWLLQFVQAHTCMTQ